MHVYYLLLVQSPRPELPRTLLERIPAPVEQQDSSARPDKRQIVATASLHRLGISGGTARERRSGEIHPPNRLLCLAGTPYNWGFRFEERSGGRVCGRLRSSSRPLDYAALPTTGGVQAEVLRRRRAPTSQFQSNQPQGHVTNCRLRCLRPRQCAPTWISAITTQPGRMHQRLMVTITTPMVWTRVRLWMLISI